MYEYSVPIEHHIAIPQEPAQLFRLAIGILGDVAVNIASGVTDRNQDTTYHEQLQFAAQFFDSYLASQLDQEIDHYLLMLGSASYYLCGLPGSSSVLANRLINITPNLGGANLEKLLLWLLLGNFSESLVTDNNLYGEFINAISILLMEHFNSGTNLSATAKIIQSV